MGKPAFKVAYVPWWRPVRLAKRTDQGYEFVGWVWRQRAYLVNNLVHGWIAFDSDQTLENIDVWFCPQCGASLWGQFRQRVLKALGKESTHG